ncbi:MAG: hypothetical protein U0Y10_17470 [Spirosomataceae bacterium]
MILKPYSKTAKNYNYESTSPIGWLTLFLMGLFLFSSCAKRTLPNGGVYFPMPEEKPDYSIGVFYDANEPPYPYEVIKELEIAEEKDLSAKDKPVGGRMLYRGITKEQKDALINKLVVQAQEIGASAVINVKYRYFTAANYDGYSVKGKAVRYKVSR